MKKNSESIVFAFQAAKQLLFIHFVIYCTPIVCKTPFNVGFYNGFICGPSSFYRIIQIHRSISICFHNISVGAIFNEMLLEAYSLFTSFCFVDYLCCTNHFLCIHCPLFHPQSDDTSWPNCLAIVQCTPISNCLIHNTVLVA